MSATIHGTRGDRTSPASADRTAFVVAMASAVSGVGILTTDGPAGRAGITVSSVTSASADPPLLLVCVHRASPAHDAVRENGVFGVSLLSANQREVADRFAGRPAAGDAYDFSSETWSTGATAVPRLPDAVASFDCRLEQIHVAGSHSVFIGRVVATANTGGSPLLYTNRSYGLPQPLH